MTAIASAGIGRRSRPTHLDDADIANARPRRPEQYNLPGRTIVKHAAKQTSMLRRAMAPHVVAAYIRDMQSSELFFTHAGWQTPTQPTKGLMPG